MDVRTLIKPTVQGQDMTVLPYTVNYRARWTEIREGMFQIVANGAVTTSASVTFDFTMPQNSSWVCLWAARCAQSHNGRLRVLGGTTLATHALTANWQHFADTFTYANAANKFQLEMQDAAIADWDQMDIAYCVLLRRG